METFRQKIYNWLRMRSVYRRVKNVSVVIGTAAMVLIAVISIAIYIHSTMELLQERESRYLSAYSTNIVNELFSISSDVSELAECESMQKMLAEQYPLTEQARQYKRLVLTQEAERQLAYNDAVTDVYLFTTRDETVVLLSHKKPDSVINVKVEFGEGEGKIPLDNIEKRAESYKPKERVTYKMIKEYIEEKYGFKVHTAYIAEVKRDLGLPMYDAPNAVEELKQPRKHPTPEKVEAIKDALKHFEII